MPGQRPASSNFQSLGVIGYGDVFVAAIVPGFRHLLNRYRSVTPECAVALRHVSDVATICAPFVGVVLGKRARLNGHFLQNGVQNFPEAPQLFQVLRMLLEREGKVVTREEFKGRLWPNDTVVGFINATINTLRRALSDSADDPRYIETSARRGYRLMLPIQYLESTKTAVEKDREQSAAEISVNTARVHRQMN
jgi:DNA-binding winged helix-turn-helix (wHTH) protein